MAFEAVRGSPASLALPLIAGALVGACRGEAEPVANAPAAVPPAAVAPAPAELAQRLVRERLGAGAELSFAEPQIFNSGGATIVCGRVGRAGQSEQRYVAIGEEDIFVESQMEPGQMDQATAEFCRNA